MFHKWRKIVRAYDKFLPPAVCSSFSVEKEMYRLVGRAQLHSISLYSIPALSQALPNMGRKRNEDSISVLEEPAEVPGGLSV